MTLTTGRSCKGGPLAAPETSGASRGAAGRRRISARRGFTLLELVLVMVVVCIALATTAPALRDFWRGSQGRDQALQILALAQWARSYAVTEARVFGLRFDLSSGTYRLEASDGLGSTPLLSEFGRVFVLPDGCMAEVTVTPGAEPNCVRFYPDGTTDGVRISLRGPGSDEIEIAVRSPTEEFVLLSDEEALPLR